MKITSMERDGVRCALVESTETVIVDPQSALDLLVRVKYEMDANAIVLSKELIAEDFFILSTGLAGEILQKFINYGGRIAIYGDYSHYTSKPLQDFIYESNKGKDVFFVALWLCWQNDCRYAGHTIRVHRILSYARSAQLSGVPQMRAMGPMDSTPLQVDLP